MLKRPKIEDRDDLIEVLSPDSPDDLLRFISLSIAKTSVGKMIGDLYEIHDEIIDWTHINEADELLPFQYGEKKQRHKYRWWWLSRTSSEANIKRKYYWGCWLDLRIKMVAGRQHIEHVRVCDSALTIFVEQKGLIEELYG
jgi:hypothetical protein